MVIVEYLPRGSLQSVLYTGTTPLEWRTKLKIVNCLQLIDSVSLAICPPPQLRDISAGMAYLHSQSVLHRMLTPRNILVSKTSGVHMGGAWSTYGRGQEYIWEGSGVHMGGAWSTYGRGQEYIWEGSGVHMGGVWSKGSM